MRVPTAVTQEVRGFAEELAEHGRAVYVKLEARQDAEQLDCFAVVDRAVAVEGGRAVLGWRIWENVGFWLEAEFHAVWSIREGELPDVTPAQGSFDRILFVPDTQASYKGRQVNNRFCSLSGHPAIAEYVEAENAHYELMNRGARADQHGEVVLPPSESRGLEQISMRAQSAFARLEEARTWSAGRNDRCPCGSGRKYKACCMGPPTLSVHARLDD